MGDPKVREQRLYYEPFNSFLQNKDENENKSFADSGLRVVNIMIPNLDKGLQPESGVILPLTLSRHHAAVSRNASRFRGGSTDIPSYLPKVVGSSVAEKTNKNSQKSLLRFYNPEIPGKSNIEHLQNLAKRKTLLSLPRIGMKKDDDETENLRKSKKRKGAVNNNQPQQKAMSVHLPSRKEENRDEYIRTSNGFPRRATTTATGKSHLIGPMNKMDIIADYSKALQSGLITYNEYIKKLSILSLHKVPLGNSSQRQFHLVRDEKHHMKPHLTHVDLKAAADYSIMSSSDQNYSNRINRPSFVQDRVEKAQTAKSAPNDLTHNGSLSDRSNSWTTDSKSAQPRLHRIDIGEGLSLFEKKQPVIDFSDDVIMTDLTRYTHVHHPRQGRLAQYHWSHDSASLIGSGADASNIRHLHNSSTEKQANYSNSSVRQDRKRNEENGVSESKPKVLLSMEEYLKIYQPNYSANSSKSKQNNDLPVIGEYDDKTALLGNSQTIVPVQESLDYIGKIPYPVHGSEPVGLGAKDIIKSVKFGLSLNPQAEYLDQDDLSDVDSVFQSHLDNMRKTIEKAKASKKRSKVPELKGLVPTVIPKVRVENAVKKEDGVDNVGDGVKSSEANNSFLEIQKEIPENTPPPTSHLRTKDNEEAMHNSSVSVPSTFSERSLKIPIRDHRFQSTDNVSHSQLIVNQIQATPVSPRSVQSNRSDKKGLSQIIQEEGSWPEMNTEIRIMTASVDLVVPSNDDDMSDEQNVDRSRLEVVITSMPLAPPASLATSSEGDPSDNEAD